jgi:C4-type Zn-finger protein
VKVCETCLRAIESRGESVPHSKAEIIEKSATCDVCGEEYEGSELNEI